MRSYKKNNKFRITFNSPVVLSFIAICFIATVLGMISAGNSTQWLFSTYRSSLTNPFTWIRGITHVFGHVDFQHFINNSMYILILGPLLEEKYGNSIMIKAIAVTAISTSVINAILFENVALCGASGVVFAFIIMASFTRFKEGEIPLTFVLVVVIFIGQQIYQGVVYDDNISQMAHIVGGVIGGFFGYVSNKS